MNLSLRIVYAIGIAATSPLAPLLLIQRVLGYAIGRDNADQDNFN